MSERAGREALAEAARRMHETGLTRGTSGNLSLRLDQECFLITPSGHACETMAPENIVRMSLDGSHEGSLPPSSEWRIHRDLYRSRSDAGAVVHAHPVWAMTVACLGRDIPPFHYMIAMGGGSTIRCASYATYGTAELSDHALLALESRRACLLANHGLLCLESTLDRALILAIEIETLCRVYVQALSVGEPSLLDEEEIRRVGETFSSYGSGWPLLERTE
jgi:L-fuculose-phosphate aldolase